MSAIQWSGTIDSADEVYRLIGAPFQPIWAFTTLVDNKPIFDPLYGSPMLCLNASDGEVFMAPGDWILKEENGFKLIKTTQDCRASSIFSPA